MNIKGQEFGTGKPVICTPVVERTRDQIIATIGKMIAMGTKMIEWRMDWYEDVLDGAKVALLLQEIAPLVTDTVLLCTFRSKRQGGAMDVTPEEYLALNEQVAVSGVADLIDLEYYEISKPESMIEKFHQSGVKVVCSNHNFEETPSVDAMQQQLSQMILSGADFSKLAVMPREKADVLHLMEAALHTKKAYPDGHIIAMSMGKEGVISRLLGGWYHSEVTFVSFEKASAPGQILYEKATELIEMIQECIQG